MQTISKAELVEKLAAIRGATFATIVAETDARLRKTGNPFTGVVKVSRVSVTLNSIYENSVNRQREREGNTEVFEAEPRAWGVRMVRDDGTVAPIVEHKGKYYVEAKVEKSLGYEYIHNGEILDEDKIVQFLPKKSSGGERQEVEKPVILRDYSVDSIREIRFGGELYIVR